MAAMPALIALPGLLLQPWSFLVLLYPRIAIASPFVTSFVTLGVYQYLSRKTWFQKLVQRLPRLTIAQWFWTVGSLVVAALVVMLARFKDIPALKTGLSSATYELKTALPDFRQQGQFYQLPSFLDKEGLWRVQMNQSQLQSVLSKLDLEPISASQFPKQFNGMPPYWWRPQHNPTTQYFSTGEFFVEQERSGGFHAIALWNPGDQYLYLWYRSFF